VEEEAMKEHPILFSAPMVRAILAGQKTQTRRLITPSTSLINGSSPSGYRPSWSELDFGDAFVDGGPSPAGNPGPYLKVAVNAGEFRETRHRIYPRRADGDRLWVRESFRSWRDTCEQDEDYDDHEHDEHCDQTYVAYAATPRQGYRPKPDKARITYLDESTPLESDRRLLGPWKPGIHMPRWASRLTLTITSVRAERLQDISEADAKAEGAACRIAPGGDLAGAFAGLGGEIHYRAHFRDLWDAINGERAPWSSNPWVWCVSFEVIR
jgi:hypothetical protein